MAAPPRYRINPQTGRTEVVYPDGSVVPVLGAPNGTVETRGAAPALAGLGETGQGAQQQPGLAPTSRTVPGHPGSPSPGGLPSYADGSQYGDARGVSSGPSDRSGTRLGSNYVQSAQPQRGGHPNDGGGGGGASATYWNLRNKLSSAGSSSSSYGSYKSYDSGSSFAEPKEEKMRGPYAKGLDPDQAQGLMFRPTAMLPRVFPKLEGATPLYDLMSSLPAAQLAMLSKRGFDGGPSDLANGVGKLYQGFGNNELPDFDTLWNNLSSPKKSGGIAELFQGAKAGKGDYDPYGSGYEYGKEPLPMGEAASTYQGLLDAVLATTMPTETAGKYSAQGNYLIDQASSKALKRPAGKGTPIYKSVGRRLFR
jgi:hypothetical protein